MADKRKLSPEVYKQFKHAQVAITIKTGDKEIKAKGTFKDLLETMVIFFFGDDANAR